MKMKTSDKSLRHNISETKKVEKLKSSESYNLRKQLFWFQNPKTLVVSNLHSETKCSGSSPVVTYVQRWLSTVIAWLMSKCVSSGWKW